MFFPPVFKRESPNRYLGLNNRDLATGYQEAGYHSATWNADGQSSGVYIVRLTVSNEFGRVQYSRMSKLILLR